MNLRAYLAGLRADSINNTVIFEQGSFGHESTGLVYTVNSEIHVDITTMGPNGRDRVANWSDGQAIYFFLIGNDLSGEIAGLASPGYNYGDVIVPSGWSMLRKHPFMINFRTVWGGIPSFHFTGSQNPRIDFSLADTSSNFLLTVPAAPANVPTQINMNPLMPVAGGARMAHVRYAIYATGGTAGTAYLSPNGTAMTELGAANPALGGATWGETTVRVPSDGLIYYMRNTTGITLALFLRGFTVTEVTN